MHNPNDASQSLSALRQVISQRQIEMAKLAALGHLDPYSVALESRQLTCLLRQMDTLVNRVPPELPPGYQFSDEELGACLDLQIARLRATGTPDQAHHLALIKNLLGLGSVDIPLPAPADDDEEAAAVPEL